MTHASVVTKSYNNAPKFLSKREEEYVVNPGLFEQRWGSNYTRQVRRRVILKLEEALDVCEAICLRHFNDPRFAKADFPAFDHNKTSRKSMYDTVYVGVGAILHHMVRNHDVPLV